MEVYDDGKSLFDFPVQFDNSLDVKGFVEFFSARSKSGMSTGIINKYTFSYNNTYLCIASSGSHYRVIGRLFHCERVPVKRCADFEVFKIGSLSECVQYWLDCVHLELSNSFLV